MVDIVVGVAFNLGGIGDTLIGEFPLGTGKLLTIEGNIINMVAYPPSVAAGASVEVPTVTISLGLLPPEINARRRKMVTQVILS